jgi:hypothetical protein
MKKIVLNISDCTYEKLRFEAMFQRKNIPDVILERIFYKPFQDEVEEAFAAWLESEIAKIIEG